MTLPAMLNAHGEIVRLISAEHLLQAASLEDPTAADVEALAQFTDNADHLAAIAKEAKYKVSDELVRRLDRRGRWTLHEAGWTITAPSPEAGTVRYDNEQLAAALERLIQEDLIDPEAAVAAIEWFQPRPPDPYWKQKPAGIKALLKRGGEIADAIDACRVPADPPRRAAKVKRAA